MISALPLKYDVSEAAAQIAANPSVWNRHRDRLDRYGSPHSQVSDIWVRYNAIENMAADPVAFFQEPHESVWYPVADELPAVRSLVDQLQAEIGGKLGGVLITKIPAGGEVKPHIDSGWHAGYYSKYAIQLAGNRDQVFWFEDCELRPETGDVYTFRNDVTHAVYNRSDEDRMTLIVCIRREDDAL